MLEIKNIAEEHIASAIKLTDIMKWDLVEEDFELMTELEPEGCFAALDDEEFVGLTTTITFENLGWIGNVIVDPHHREKGIGSRLVRHAMDYLKHKGATTIGLYSYQDTVPFYGRLGFTKDKVFTYLTGVGVKGNEVKNVKIMGDEEFEEATKLDRCYFGVSRERLLRNIFTNSRELCYVTYNGDALVGFVMATKYANTVEIGPLVCDNREEDKATDLLKVLLGRFIGCESHIGASVTKMRMLSTLRELGFIEDFKVIRMYFGKKQWDKGRVFAMESLERG